MPILAGFVAVACLLYGTFALAVGDRLSAVDAFVIAGIALAVCAATWRRPPKAPLQ